MGLSCLVNGHELEKVGEVWVEDLQDGFYASNYGFETEQHGKDKYLCKKCGKVNYVKNGKIR